MRKGLLYVNDQPWMPWGAIYGHVPVYAGPADPGLGQYRDLRNLPAWSIYDGFTAEPYSRSKNNFNCLRYFPGYGETTDLKLVDSLEHRWQQDNLYCSTFFVVPSPGAFSPEELVRRAGGQEPFNRLTAFAKTAPMVVSTGPGIEEAFGLFHSKSPDELKGLQNAVEQLRRATGKPVMVSHGGYWNRLEFEKVPFFDIYDPETEPLYPANLHTDLAPLIEGQDKTIWLRPQMYEDVPYERWRFHVYTELMRGARGWQIAHGPGDQSLFRGLHGELEFMKPIAYSTDLGPTIQIKPSIEHWSRRHNGKSYLIAATTHGITLGQWRWDDEQRSPAGRSRMTEARHIPRDETNNNDIGQRAEERPSIHGLQYLPDARSWPAGSKVIQWVCLDPEQPPHSLVVLVKTDGRWTHAASWGQFDVQTLRNDPDRAYRFLNSLYRHAKGFLGWDRSLLEKALIYLPAQTAAMGALPSAGKWVRLEIPLEKIGATGALLDGVGFLHDGGRVWWGPTSLVTPDGIESVVWANEIGLPIEQRAQVKIAVEGLKAGGKIRVLFEDRELVAGDGFFTDDFRGEDQYQKFGYGNLPVALHIYEFSVP